MFLAYLFACKKMRYCSLFPGKQAFVILFISDKQYWPCGPFRPTVLASGACARSAHMLIYTIFRIKIVYYSGAKMGVRYGET